MFVQFSVDNFLSIKDHVVFSLNAGHKSEKNKIEVKRSSDDSFFLLNSAVLYGANGSGKSNLLKAMARMRSMVLNEEKVMLSTDTLVHQPFRLNTETQDASTTFEMVFFIMDSEKGDSQKVRYGFEFDNKNIYAEWLFVDTNGKEAKQFTRDENESYVNPSFKEGYDFFDKKSKEIKVPKNQLFLWKCDQNLNKLAANILKWFQSLNMVDGVAHDSFGDYPFGKMKETDFRKDMERLIKEADIGINSIKLQEKKFSFTSMDQLLESKDFLAKPLQEIITIHSVYDETDIKIDETEFILDKDESKGTVKYFRMLEPVLDTLKNGSILMIDELDSSLHPLLSIKLVEMFQNPKINTKGAQLIFATHDTNLLKPQLFNRDQIWFSEKNKQGATDVYSLSDIKGVRPDEAFEKQYLQGKYGAIPFLGNFEF